MRATRTSASSSRTRGRAAGSVVFDPLRAVAARARDVGLAIGGGAHMCTGQRMALENAQAVTDDPGDPVGIVPRLLLGLYRAGVELDPSRPPTLVDRNRQ